MALPHYRYCNGALKVETGDWGAWASKPSSFRFKTLCANWWNERSTRAAANGLCVFSFREGFNAAEAGRKLGRFEASAAPADPLWRIVPTLHQEAVACGSSLRSFEPSRAQWPDVHRLARRRLYLSHPRYRTYHLLITRTLLLQNCQVVRIILID